MINVARHPKNPVLKPNEKNPFEAHGVMNGGIVKMGEKYILIYRAESNEHRSVIAKAESKNGFDFTKREIFIEPTEEWDKFGCEDPRVTFIDGKYYIFYTALSEFPFRPEGIKVGLAISSDLVTIEEKHLITPFNAKGMSLFPEKINGKYAAMLTADSDYPPSTIGVAYFTDLSEMWSEDYWNKWHESVKTHTVPLVWSEMDRVDVGAPAVKTPYGWFLVYCTIQDHNSPGRQFQINGVLLDINDPQKVIGIVKDSLLIPTEDYEINGNVGNTIFPTSVTIENNIVSIYYSACDTSICLAEIPLPELYSHIQINNVQPVKMEKFDENPILTPIASHEWEAGAVLNPAAIKLNDKIYIIYRAISPYDISSFGLAITTDGIYIDERLPEPIYKPREDFESRGCEDPRITQIGDKLYICYTAWRGEGNTRVAMTSITVEDFLNRKWEGFEKPILITAPENYDKDACVLPEKIGGQYVFFHRITPGISVDRSVSLVFGDSNWLKTKSYIVPRPNTWDDEKIGIGPTPMKTSIGWLLIYHGISNIDHFYRGGAMLLDPLNPQLVTARTKYPILEPTLEYEKNNGRGIDFPCGMVEMGEYLYVYYGAGDKNIALAKVKLMELLNYLENQSYRKFLKYKL